MTLKVLIANDDGIYSEGIRVLSERLSSQYDVYVVAPDRERSAMGHALTLHKPIRVDEVDLGPQIKQAFAITGTPSDCVKIALNALLDIKPDIVVSGINHGPNLGADVLYSGTLSAAIEGAIHGLPSVAVSLINGYEKFADFRPAADFVCNFLPRALDANLPPKIVLNVNFPAVPYADVTACRFTRLGLKMYTDTFEKRIDPRNNVYYWLAGEVITQSNDTPDTDIAALRDNAISITPIGFDLTHEKVLAQFGHQFESTNHPL
jgi:5'-nucleotidase